MQAQDCQYSIDEILYGAGHNTIQLYRVTQPSIQQSKR